MARIPTSRFQILALFVFFPGVLLAQTYHASATSGAATDLSKAQRLETHETDNPSVAPGERNPRYRINRDDVLSLSFPLAPEFNQPKVMVQPDGYITLQGAGSIYVQGLRVPDAVEAVKDAYSKTLHDPVVDIDLVDFQKPFFVVLGQVGRPGQYDLRYDITVTEAIAVAGGFSSTAKTQVFLYHRGEGSWVIARELKLKDILHGKNVSEDVSMRPGDMIFVQEKTISKIRRYVPYGVGTNINPSPMAY